MISKNQKIIKRTIDILLSLIGLLTAFPVIVLCVLISSLLSRKFGIFVQKRVGRYGKPFNIYKIRTMKGNGKNQSNITVANDKRIFWFGKILRKYKIDELPQLWNVLKGDMSFVGPRPDVEGFADQLKGDEKIILDVRPGITGPASIFFKNEELTLSKVENVELYNRNVIYPKKIELNMKYIEQYSVLNDIKWIIKTIFG